MTPPSPPCLAGGGVGRVLCQAGGGVGRVLCQAKEEEAGQSMVEFAIILPLLLLLTFGTIELSVFLSRQITLTGASFLAARAATVGGQDGNDPSRAASEVLGAYAEDSGQNWLKSIVDGTSGKLSVETDAKERLMRVSAVKKNEQWTGSYGNSLKPTIGALGTEIAINREFVLGKNDRSAVQRRTDLEIDYSANLGNIDKLYGGSSTLLSALISKIGDSAAGLKGVLVLEPFQAVAKNPGQGTYLPEPGRSLGAVYASSDAEKPGFEGPGLNQSAKLVGKLHTGANNLRRAREGIMAVLAAIPDPTGLIKLGILEAGALLEGSTTGAEAALTGLEGTVFGVSGALP